MSKRKKIFISIGEWEYKRRYGIPYAGYVIGVGYAYVIYKTLTEDHQNDQSRNAYQSFVPAWINRTDSVSYFPVFNYRVVTEQHLDTGEEAVMESFPPTALQERAPFLSARARTMAWGIKHGIIATDIGEYEYGSNNITSTVVRFVTRDGLQENKGWEREATERNAYRHVLWQSYIASKYGVKIAREVGNVHEDNPDANISQRHFKTRKEADQIIDLLNNRIGQTIGRRFPKGTAMNIIAIKVLDEFYKDGFYTGQITGEGTFYIDRTTITEQQYEQLKAIFETLNHLGRTEEEQKEKNRKEAERQKVAREKLEIMQGTWGTMK